MVAKYTALIAEDIEGNWIKPQNVATGLRCRLSISVAPNGNVKTVKISKSSGDNIFDRSAIAAVHKAAPLVLPDDPRAAAKVQAVYVRI